MPFLLPNQQRQSTEGNIKKVKINIKYNKKPTKGLLISAVYVLVLCSSICLSVTSWYCVKTAERIQLIFGGFQTTIAVSYNMLER